MIEPCTFVIFGATGNLSQNKLLPALYHLEEAARLPEGTTIICFGRREWNTEQWRDEVAVLLKTRVRHGLDEKIYEHFRARLHYFQGDMTDAQAFQNLKQMLEANHQFPDNKIFYLAIRPAEYGAVSQHLASAGLHEEDGGWRRKPVHWWQCAESRSAGAGPLLK